MTTSKLTAVLAAFVGLSSANYFSLTNFVASDIRVPSASHHISFHLTNSDTKSQERANHGTNCTISWNGTIAQAPKCYTTCESPKGDVPEIFLTRVVPGEYKSAGNFQIEILEFFHDYVHGKHTYDHKLDSRNSATVKWVEGQNDVFCSRGGQSDVCSVLGGGAWNVTYETNHHVKHPRKVCK